MNYTYRGLPLRSFMEADNRIWVEGDVQVSSGSHSNHYFDGKRLTLSTGAGLVVGAQMIGIAREYGAEIVAGVALGGIPIAAHISALSSLGPYVLPNYRDTHSGDLISKYGWFIPGAIIRDTPKAHGMEREIEGTDVAGARVMVVDDVCTTGRSISRSVDTINRLGGQVVCAAVIMARGAYSGDIPFECLLQE